MSENPEDERGAIPRTSTKRNPAAQAEEDQALAKLEDHRCSLCQKILINACRIDCGHVFCRHCLNLDKERVNERGKPTCHICDAAVTEITRNKERDKEIDNLYAHLCVQERLDRARSKAERQVEEESFATKPLITDQMSRESVGSGDATTNRATVSGEYRDEEGESDWQEDSFNASSFLDGTFPPPFWRRRSYDYGSEDYDDRQTVHRDRRALFQESTENSPPHFNWSEDTNTTGDDCNFSRRPFTRPHQSPIVIHHTVQHVYHAHDTRNANNNTNTRDTSNSGTTSQSQNSPSPPRTSPYQGSCRFQNDNQFRTQPSYTSSSTSPHGFYRPHQSYGNLTQSHYSTPSLFQLPATYSPTPQPTPFYSPSYYHPRNPSAESHPPSRAFYATATALSDNSDNSDSYDSNDNSDAGRRENLCDFHRALLRDQVNQYEDSREFPTTPNVHPSYPNGFHVELDFTREENEEDEDEPLATRSAMASEDDGEDDQDTITLSFTIPVSFHEVSESGRRSEFRPSFSGFRFDEGQY